MKAKLLLALAVAAFCSGNVSAQPAVGDFAPRFSLPFATRDSVSRLPCILDSVLSTGPAVLAFYPADWSGGCTKEVCAIRDAFAQFSELNVRVLGISGDYVYSHHEWAKHHNLPFILLSDHLHAVAKAYGSYNEATGFNRRTVFVIDRSGRIAYADLQYNVADDGDLRLLKEALTHVR